MLIVFEGIRKSGKSTLSLALLEYLNDYVNEDGTLKLDPHLGDFVWKKEPTFPDEQANDLNYKEDVNEYLREKIFFESRIKHQDDLAGANVVCERYIWCALAHSHRFSPNCFNLIKELYLSENMFIQPDLYIFVDTSPEVCYERSPDVDLGIVKEIRDSYAYTSEFIRKPILYVDSFGGEERAISSLLDKFNAYVEEHDMGGEKW